MKKINVYHAYTDGACSKIGVGGAGMFMYSGSEVSHLLTLKQDSSTNNQMELTGAILALRAFEIEVENTKAVLNVYTDSQYVQKGITEWIYNWRKKNWMSTSVKPVVNKELWLILDELRNRLIKNGHTVNIEWVRGHNGNIGNEIADFLATNVKFNTVVGRDRLYNPDNKIINTVKKFIAQAECDIAGLKVSEELDGNLLWDFENENSNLIDVLQIILE